MSSADSVQDEGLGILVVDGQRSIWLSHDALVGVKCRWKRGWRRSHLWIIAVLWVV